MFPHRSAEEDNLPACQAEAEAAAGVPGAFVDLGVRAVQEGGGWFGPWSREASGPWGEGDLSGRVRAVPPGAVGAWSLGSGPGEQR